MRKNKQFSIRISEQDLETIRQKAAQAHMSQSDYVTACCLGKRTSLLQLPQGSVDPGELLCCCVQIGELYLAHVRQHSQLVEVIADGFLLPQDFFQSVQNHNPFSETTGGHIIALAHVRLRCFSAYRFQILF